MSSSLQSSLALTALLAALACNSADFGGTNSAKAPPATADCAEDDPNCEPGGPDGGPGPGDPTPSECSEGDKLSVEWTGEVKECLIDQGKTYNFDLEQCAEMRQSKFDCTWENVTKELEERGLLTDVLRSDSTSGAKLVSCGQSDDGNRIVVQWVRLPEGGGAIDCKKASSGASITTGCYTLYKAGEDRPADPANDDERAQQVYDCMNKL